MNARRVRRDALIRQAFDLPRTVDLNRLAAVLDVSRSMVEKYRTGRRPLPPEARLRLSFFLEAHAEELSALAAELRADDKD